MTHLIIGVSRFEKEFCLIILSTPFTKAFGIARKLTSEFGISQQWLIVVVQMKSSHYIVKSELKSAK